MKDPNLEVWVVSNKEGPEFVAGYREAAMEHAAEMAGDFPEEGPWTVCRYLADTASEYFSNPIKINQEQPPCTNEFVAPGCELFS